MFEHDCDLGKPTQMGEKIPSVIPPAPPNTGLIFCTGHESYSALSPSCAQTKVYFEKEHPPLVHRSPVLYNVQTKFSQNICTQKSPNEGGHYSGVQDICDLTNEHSLAFLPMGAVPVSAGWVPTLDVTGWQRQAPHTLLSVPPHLLLRLALALA